MKCLLMLLVITMGYLMQVTAQNLPVQSKLDIYFQIHFKNSSVVYFGYQDSNCRNASLKIANPKDGDTIIVCKITTDKPTVFTNGEIRNSHIYEQLFFGFNNNDTISLEKDEKELRYGGKDKRNYIVSNIFGTIDRFSKRITMQGFTKLQIEIENERSTHLKTLTDLIQSNPIDSISLKTIKNFIDLYYYNKLFDVNFSGEILKNWENPFYNKFLSINKETNILASVSSYCSTSILYKLVMYGAYLNKSSKKDLLENIQYLNPVFYKTKNLDGLIWNMIDIDVKTYDDRKKVLTRLKSFMLKNEETLKYSKKLIGNEVYNSTFISYNNKQVTFKDLIKSDKKLIVLDFWASWCAPCVSEIPKLKSYTKKFTNIKFISISLDKESQKWIEGCNKYNVKFDSFRILNLTNNELLKYFGIRNIPRFIVMTNKGEVLSDDFYRPSDTKFGIDLQSIINVYK